jgi:hypothetical protein
VKPSAGLMVDALRLSTLQNLQFCRVDKARRTMFGIQHVGCARRIHHGPQQTLKFGIAVVSCRDRLRIIWSIILAVFNRPILLSGR